MSGFRQESHVAQQSRRDKLRVQQSHHFDNLSSNPDNIGEVRNVRSANLLYDPTEMLNFSINNSNMLPPPPQGEANESAFGNWRNTLNPPPQSLDWVTNYNTNIAQSTPHLKNSTNYHIGFQNHHVSSDQISGHHGSEKHLGGAMNFPSPALNYISTLQDVVTSASTSNQDQQMEMASFVHQRMMENELVLLPSYANQLSTLRFENIASNNSWIDRQPVENRRNWSTSTSGHRVGFISNEANQQGLSLSLSSNPAPNKPPAAQFGSQDLLHASNDDEHGLKDAQVSKSVKSSGYLSSIPKPSIISKGCGKSLQDIVGTSSSSGYRSSTGPLGPFTGYATILKSSKFLKPAQQLMDEFCRVSDSRVNNIGEASERMSGEFSGSASVSVSNDGVSAMETEVVAKGNNSGASSSTLYGSNEFSSDGGAASISSESFRPEYQQKKAKLLFMQEEVCRRYKQYHQQMQMVVSSFESVAGLNSATPYISMALSTVSKHFKCLTNSIKDQLRHLRRALGEEYLSSSPITSTAAGCSTSKGDKNVAKLKYMGLSFQKQNKSGGGALAGFSEPQQHVWRPQRGLPERSVAILRAWLFEHFLHPYPTDTDKHMLATQTGLSRNQVSNWFINARVRVWKPMVEEIHTLETRGSVEGGLDHSKKDGNPAADQGTSSRPNNEPQLGINMMPDRQLECSGDLEQHSQEMKRSRYECQVPSGMDGGIMGFVPYQRSGLEVGGLGAVSLTLGLRHGVESAQQQQQQQQLQQHEDQLRRQLGGQMIRDFVG